MAFLKPIIRRLKSYIGLPNPQFLNRKYTISKKIGISTGSSWALGTVISHELAKRASLSVNNSKVVLMCLRTCVHHPGNAHNSREASPPKIAVFTSSAMLWASSFSIILRRFASMVLVLTCSSNAICLVFFPSLIS